MIQLKLKLEQKSTCNKAYLVYHYAGGDADYNTEVYEELNKDSYEVRSDFILDVNDEVFTEINLFEKKYTKYTEINNRGEGWEKKYGQYKDQFNDNFEEKFIEEYGEDFPTDPTCDHQLLCYLDYISLVYYASNGDKYKAYL